MSERKFQVQNGGFAAEDRKIMEAKDSSPFQNLRCETLLPIGNRQKDRSLRSHVHVSVRLKPTSLKAASKQGKSNWRVCQPSTSASETCTVLENSARGEKFAFDRIYDEAMTTEAIFRDHCSSMVHRSLRGFNMTIFAYGQTASGKTHTMHGPKGQARVEAPANT